MYRNCVCLAALCLTLALAGSAGAQLGQGYVLFEYWDGIGGTAVADLTGNANYPNNPSSAEWRNAFQSPSARADNYGVRARAYLTPPETGDYTFWVAGDDGCQLWLSTDTDPANAVMISQVPGWTGVAEWGKYPEQKSAPIPLAAGQEYYIEGLMKEGGGGDSLDVGWAGPGIGDATTIIAGQYLRALVRDPEPLFPGLFQAKNPKPADGAVDVTSPLFEWTAGVGAVMHDIYFGTTPELGAADFKNTMPVGMYYHLEPLTPGMTYYWRIDEVDAAGAKTEGNVWSFTVMPLEAHAPNPPVGATFVPLTIQLSWTAGQNAAAHDVYLGTDEAAVTAGDASALVATVAEASYQAAGLEPETTYYWRVDEADAAGVKVPGDVWSFSTLPVIAPVDDPNLVGWWTFEMEPDNSLVVLDMSGNGHYGTLLGGGITFEDDAEMGAVLDLPGGNGKYVSIGAVGISGNDPTTIACWAKRDNVSIPDWTLIFGFTGTVDGAGGNGSHFNIGSLGGPGGVGAHVWGWEETIFTDNEALEWHHYAMTYDGTTIRYYGDGYERDTDLAKSNVRDLTIRGDRVHIGKRRTQESSFPGRVDDCRVYDRVLTAEEIQAIAMDKAPVIAAGADVTSPRDFVRGVPNDGDWPAAETPRLAIDNRSNTKYLHRKGGLQPTGLQITPAAGPSLVTGMTFTTANDVPDRDPVTFELYGSNESIDGPWTLIAAGDIVDFAGADAWPRFTKNTTPITFANDVVYTHYQVLFPTIRNPAAVVLMQIAEIELLSPKPVVVWVSFHGADDAPGAGAAGAGFTAAPDKAYTDLLEANGYDVVRYVTTGTPDVDVLNAADLVIISRSVNSGHYSNASATTWNGISAPLIITGGYTLRANRMGFATGNTIPDTTGDITLTVSDPTHPIFAGIALTDGTMANPFAGVVTYANGTVARGISIVTDPADDEATVLATVSAAGNGPAGAMVIAEWPAGATLTHDGGAGTDVLAGPRLVFLTGAREASGISSETAGMYDLYEDGAQMFLNAVEYMLQ